VASLVPLLALRPDASRSAVLPLSCARWRRSTTGVWSRCLSELWVSRSPTREC